MSDAASVGLLGLGALGEIFCGHLARALPGLRVFDLDADKVARAAAEHGAVATTSARELGAGCEVVVVSLPNPAAVQRGADGPDGLLEDARAGAVVARHEHDLAAGQPRDARGGRASAASPTSTRPSAAASPSRPASTGRARRR